MIAKENIFNFIVYFTKGKALFFFFYTKLTCNNFFVNWDLLYARLNSHYETWSYKKKKYKKIKAYRKVV